MTRAPWSAPVMREAFDMAMEKQRLSKFPEAERPVKYGRWIKSQIFFSERESEKLFWRCVLKSSVERGEAA